MERTLEPKSFIYVAFDLQPCVFQCFCSFSSFLPEFQRSGVTELSISDMNIKKETLNRNRCHLQTGPYQTSQ